MIKRGGEKDGKKPPKNQKTKVFTSTLGQPSETGSAESPACLRPHLRVGEVHSVLYEGVVGPVRLHALLDGGCDPRQASVQSCQVGLAEDRVDGVKGHGLPHGCTQRTASQEV